MYGQISTVAFVGIEAKPVEVQVRISGGQHAFAVVGLPDKAVNESRERVRNALHAVGLGLPFKHITVNLAPADLPKEGSHKSANRVVFDVFSLTQQPRRKHHVSIWCLLTGELA
jgi:predicted ATPase with chaperone activity